MSESPSLVPPSFEAATRPGGGAATLAAAPGDPLGPTPLPSCPVNAVSTNASSASVADAKAKRAVTAEALARAKGKAKDERTVNSKGKRHTRKKERRSALRALKYDGKMPLLSGETAQMQRGRRIADATAAQILERAAVDGGRINDDDILRVFRQWRFKRMTRGLMCYPRKTMGFQRHTRAHP